MRGSIRRRGKTSWELKFDAPTDNGLRKTRYVSFKGSRQDAQRELTRLLGQLDAGVLADPSNVTVAQYLEAWLRGPIGSPKTIERYGELLKNQIAPHLGTIRLQKLRPEHIRKWHNDLRETGLAPATVRHAHKLLNRILVDALKAGVVSRNVASVFRPPAVEQVEIEILTAEQVTEVLTALAGHWLHPIVALALATGARRGELLALQWGDVNLDAGTLRIERSVERRKPACGLRRPRRDVANAPSPCHWRRLACCATTR
jgi:integrase-like protein